jgi:hypothetical protein
MNIIKVIAIGAIGFSLASCATTGWDKPGATQQDYATDSYNCEKDMRQGGYYGSGLFGALNAQSFEDRCMVAHGWRARSK